MFDLHCHSQFSDGDFSPADVAKQAKRAGLVGVVLTDHNTYEGYREFQSECRRLGLGTLMGVEVSTSYDGIDTHILGYAREFSGEKFNDLLARIRKGYFHRVERILGKLQNAGVTKLFLPDVQRMLRKESERHTMTKYDIARALVQEQNLPMERIEEVQKHVEKGGVGYEPYGSWAVHPREVVRIIREAGGFPVLAHPLDFMKRSAEQKYEKGLKKVDALLSQLVNAGLQGIEVSCSVHNEEQEACARSFAEQFHLFPTAGTDWHGPYHHPNRHFGEKGLSPGDFHAFVELLNAHS